MNLHGYYISVWIDCLNLGRNEGFNAKKSDLIIYCMFDHCHELDLLIIRFGKEDISWYCNLRIIVCGIEFRKEII